MALTGVLNKFSFAKKVPLLLKATSDDANPTPGYLFDEIAKISNESLELCEELVSFLLERVKKSSHHVKLKALLVIKAVLEKGNSEFRHSLSRQSDAIREARSFNGPPDALYGGHVYAEIRKAASVVLEMVFNVENSSRTEIMHATTASGDQPMAPKKMEGFGNTLPAPDNSFATSIKKLATSIPESLRGKMTGNSSAQNYRQYVDNERPTNPTPSAALTSVFQQRVATGIKTDYPRQTWNSIQNGDGFGNDVSKELYQGRRDWREIGQTPSIGREIIQERAPVEVKYPERNHFLQEVKIVEELTSPGGVRVGQSKGEVDQFLKRCSTLNVVKIIQLLRQKLDNSNPQVQLRTLVLLESLWYSPIEIAKETIIMECRVKLIELKESAGIAVKTKADKILMAINPQITRPDLPESSQTQSLLAESPPTDGLSFAIGQPKLPTPEQNLLVETTEPTVETSIQQDQGATPVSGMFSGLNLTEFDKSSAIPPRSSQQDESIGLLGSFGGSDTNFKTHSTNQSKTIGTDSFESLFLDTTSSKSPAATKSAKENQQPVPGSLDLLDLDPFGTSGSSQPVRGDAVAKNESADVLPLAVPLTPAATTTSPQRSPYQPFITNSHFPMSPTGNAISPKVVTPQINLLNLSSQPQIVDNKTPQNSGSSSLIDLNPAAATGRANNSPMIQGAFAQSALRQSIPMARPGFYVNNNQRMAMGPTMAAQINQNTTPIRMNSQSQSSSGFDFISKRGDAFDFVKDAIEQSKKKK